MSKLLLMLINFNLFILLIEGIPQLDKTLGRTGQSYSPAGQDSWPNWTNLKGLHSGRGFLGINEISLVVLKKKTSEKIAESL